MGIEVWFRNPDYYIKECVEVSAYNLAWDRGYLVKRNIDPVRFGDLYFAANQDFRMLCVGDQGTSELRRGTTFDKPAAVYPTWEYGQELSILEALIENPAGDDWDACNDKRIPGDERPVYGQEHRVVVTRIPILSSGPGRKFVRLLSELQDENPGCIIHVHGIYSYRVAFGMSFRSVDVEPRLLAKKGKVTLPSGKEVTYERAALTPQWVRVVGFAPGDLEVPRNRCMFNMKSALWAADHYKDNFKFKSTRHAASPVDYVSPSTAAAQSRHSRNTNGEAAKLDDKWLCDTCSLAAQGCKYYREGSVCSLPDSETSSLAKMFKSRDAGQIVDALAEILARQVARAEAGLEDEDVLGELDPEVSKALNAIFANGVKLAKLRNPKLTGGPQVGIQFNIPAGLAEAKPKELTAAAVRALEEAGYSRDQITPELVEEVVQPAIEAQSRVHEE